MPAMRLLLRWGFFLLMTAVLLVSWRHRFERAAGSVIYHLKAPVALKAGPETPRVALLDFPGVQSMSFLRVKFTLMAKGLEVGHEKFEDGRMIMEWGGKGQMDQFSSIRNTCFAGDREFVLRPEGEAAVPRLRLENLGRSGEMRLESFEAEALTETLGWKWMRCLLMLAWVGWAAVWIGQVGSDRYLRPALVAVGSLVMVIFVVVPGPWKFVPPMVLPFTATETGMSSSKVFMESVTQAGGPAEAPVAGGIPEGGSFILQVKHHAEAIRPILHGTLLMIPTLAAACAVGRHRAVKLMVLISLLIEAAQMAFGFGFDLLDVFDLTNDAIGIALGVAAHHLLLRKSPQAVRRWILS